MLEPKTTELISRDSILEPESYRPPVRPEEAVLASIWARALRVDRVGLDDDFFDLGGDSLAAISIVESIRDELGRTVPTHRLIEAPTITLMLREIGERLVVPTRPDTTGEELTFNLRSEGTLPPVILIPPRDDSAMRFRALSDAIARGHPVGAVVHHARSDLASLVGEQLACLFREYGHRPMHFIGICWGSLPALEMARQSVDAGIVPASTILLDPPPLLRRRDRFFSRLRREVFPWTRLLTGRTAAFWQQMSSTPREHLGRFLLDKMKAARSKLQDAHEREALELEARGDQRFQRLTEMGLAYRPRPPSGKVALVLTRDRPSSPSRRARQSWIAALGAESSVRWVSGLATGDVLLHHLDEFAQVVNLLLDDDGFRMRANEEGAPRA